MSHHVRGESLSIDFSFRASRAKEKSLYCALSLSHKTQNSEKGDNLLDHKTRQRQGKMKMKDMSTYPSFPLKNGRAPQSKDSRRLNKTVLTLIAVCLYSVSSSFLFMSSAFFETDSTPMAFPSRVLQERVDEKVRKDTIREKLKSRKRRRCKCLECDKDKEDCGQLWKGIQYSTAGRNVRRG